MPHNFFKIKFLKIKITWHVVPQAFLTHVLVIHINSENQRINNKRLNLET